MHCSNEAELREFLLKSYREYKERGAVQYHGIGEEIMKYSHVEMARKFAEVLDAVTAGATPMQASHPAWPPRKKTRERICTPTPPRETPFRTLYGEIRAVSPENHDLPPPQP